jgi:hypothetical protein
MQNARMSDSLGSRLRLVQELHEPTPAAAVFLARVLDEGRRELRTERWATSERSLEHLGTPLLRSTGDEGETVVLERDGVLVLIGLHGGFVYAQAAGADAAVISAAVAELRGLLPAPEPVATQDVPVVFWTYSAHGPMPSVRKIAVPEWKEIRRTTGLRRRRSAARSCATSGRRTACVGMARMVSAPLRGRSRHVLRRARRLPDDGVDAERRHRGAGRDPREARSAKFAD